MAFLDTYRQQVALLIRVLPFVAEERAFALKGGTAINLLGTSRDTGSPASARRHMEAAQPRPVARCQTARAGRRIGARSPSLYVVPTCASPW